MDEDDASEPRLPQQFTAFRLGRNNQKGKVVPTQSKNHVPTEENKSPVLKEHPLPDNQIFRSPMVLVSTVDGKTKCEESTLAKLHEIDKALNIVSVVGTLRTGKSFLLNKLARHSSGQKVGQRDQLDPDVKNKTSKQLEIATVSYSADANAWFETGHTTNAVTKGIWILCRPHPTQKDQVLVLLDTEGIDDPEKVDIEDDKNLFLLATLLSSTMVYNARENFDRNAIDKFKFLKRIKTSIKVSGSEEDDSILDFFFPNFVLTLRDVTLSIEEGLDDDTFLEKALSLKRHNGSDTADVTTDESLNEFNLPRMMIRRYFKKRRCFRFRKPVKTEQLKNLMTIPETDLKVDFQKTFNKFRNFVLSSQPKALRSGRALNGRMFTALLLSYVASIQKNEPPCLTTAMRSMAAVENTHVVKKATDVYKAEMNKRIDSFKPSGTGLVNYHKDCMQAALEVLKAGLIIDDEQIYEEQAITCFQNNFEKMKTKVEKELKGKCWDILGRLDDTIIKSKIKDQKYCTRTGYDDYMKDLDTLKDQFKMEAGYMGSVARTILNEFLDRKSDEGEIVYKMVKEAEDIQEGEEIKRRKTTIYTAEDEMILKQEEDVEEAIKAYIESTQVNGLQNIGRQYFDILITKIKEFERVKKELTRSNSYYVQLYQETKHWKDVFDKNKLNMLQTGGREGDTKESWEDVIESLWKKVMEESTDEENKSLTSQDEGIRGRKKETCDIL